MKKKIFITSVGGDVACAALRCLIEEKKYYEIIGCDIREDVQGKLYLDEFIIAPQHSDNEKYLDFIRNVCENRKIDYFLPIGEQEIILVSQIRDFFKEQGIGLVMVNDYIIEIATDKYKTHKMCREIGVLSPDTIRLEQLRKSEKMPFELPVVLKRATGCGGKGIKRIESQRQLLEVLKDKNYDENWIVQKEIGNSEEEFTMGIFSDGNNVSSLTFQRKLGFGSMSVWVKTVDDPKFHEIAMKIAKKTNLFGSINVQMRKDEKGYYVFEINPRISSSCRFRHLNGFTDVVWWIKLMDNQCPDIQFSTVQGRIGMKTLDEMLME